MFEDQRSKKIILMAHCVLNQNAKLDRCAHYPGAIKDLSGIVIERGVGIIQMPCPELLYLGLDRQVDRGKCSTVEEEDTRIAQRMAGENGKALCREIANSIVFQVEEYRKNGFEIMGLVGINGSPTCGVETTWFNGQEQDGPGVLIKILSDDLNQRCLSISMRGIKAYEPQKAAATVAELLDGIKAHQSG